MKVFSGLREDIKCLMDEMGHEPESSLERDSICPDADIFLLTHENIKALKLLLSQVLHFQMLIYLIAKAYLLKKLCLVYPVFNKYLFPAA